MSSSFSTRRADQVTVETVLVVVNAVTQDTVNFRTVSSVSLVGDDVEFTFFETDSTMTTSRGNDVDVFNRR